MSSPKIFATALFGDAAALKRVIQGLATLWPYIVLEILRRKRGRRIRDTEERATKRPWR